MLVGLVALAVAVLVVGRPLLARAIARFARDGRPEGPLLAMLLIGTFACAYATKCSASTRCSARSCSALHCRATTACSRR